MIYGLTNSKGGVGKTTIAVHLAAFLAKKKREVVFIDADPQQSATTWIRELALPMRLETLSDSEEIIHCVARFATDADDIVIDGPAGLSETTRAIMLRADKVFLPCGPSILDFRAASKAVQLLHEEKVVAPAAVNRNLDLGPGETEAIALAKEIGETLLLMDQRKGRKAAMENGLRTAGTLHILEAAAARGLLDFERAVARLLATNFHIRNSMLSEFLARVRARKN